MSDKIEITLNEIRRELEGIRKALEGFYALQEANDE